MTGNIKWWQRLCSMALVVFMLFGSVPSSAVAYAADQLNTDNSVVEQSVDPLATAEPTAEAPTETPTATDAPTEQPTAEATAAPEASAAPEATAIAAAMNAAEITGSSEYNGVTVNVVAPIGAFPEGTTLSITPVTAQQDVAAVSNAVEQTLTDTQTLAQATTFDIVFSYNGKEVQPADGKTVSVSFAMPQAIDTASEQLQVYRTEDAATATADTIEQVTASAATDNAVTVEAEHFTSYTVTVVASNGNSFAETVANGETFTLDGTFADEYYKYYNISDTWTIQSGADYIQLYEENRDNADYVAIDIGKAEVVHSYYYWHYNKRTGKWETILGRETFTITVAQAATATITDDLANSGTLKASATGLTGALTYEWKYTLVKGNTTTVDNQVVAAGSALSADGASLDVRMLLGDTDSYDTATFTVTATDAKGNSRTSEVYSLPYYTLLKNGSFEVPVTNDQYQYKNGYDGIIWKTTGLGTGSKVNHDIEIINKSGSTFHNFQYGYCFDANDNFVPDGNQFAELNCEASGALYQDVLTVPGTTLYWQLYHRARTSRSTLNGSDTMYVVIADYRAVGTITTQSALNTQIINKAEELEMTVNGDAVSVSVGDYTAKVWKITDVRAWAQHAGQYQTADNQHLTRFFFVAGDTASGDNTVGNFLDAVSFSAKVPYTFEYYVDGRLAGTETGTGDVGTAVNTGNTYTTLSAGYTLTSVKHNNTGIWSQGGGSVPTMMQLAAGAQNIQQYYFVSKNVLTVQKVVEGKQPAAGTTFAIQLTLPALSSSAVYQYSVDGSAYQELTKSNGVYTINLAAGQIASIKGLAVGGAFTVAEPSVVSGYANTSIKINGSTAASGVLSANGTAVVVTNTSKTGGMTVSKTVTGLDTAALAELEKAGGLTLSYSSAASANVSAAEQAGSVTLAQIVAAGGKTVNGSSVTYSYTFKNLPAGSYTVAESGEGLANYNLSSSGFGTAVVTMGGTVLKDVTNAYNAATISSITVTKSYSANTPASLQREVKLALYANGTKLAETTTQGLTAEFTNLKVNENGAAIQYVVKEWDENTQNYVGSGETAYIGGIAFTVGGGAVTLSSQPNEANQYTGTAAVSNAMQVTSGDADLVITKNVEGTTDNTPAHTFYFEVALKDGTEAPIAGTFGENTFDANGIARVSVDIAEGQTLNTVTLTGLPVGANYTVTEMTDANYTTAMTAGTAVSGYTLASGNAVGGTLNKNGTNAQSFTNTYATNPVAVKVSATKTMTGRKLTAEDTFKANLYQVSANGTVAGTAKLSAALTGDAAGATTDTFAFGSLNFTDAADAVTYYAIQEVKDGKGVTTWDGTVADASGTQADMPDHFFRVTLTDNGTGSLSAVVETGSFANGAFVPDAAALTADENGTYNVASVTNDYQASDTLGDDGTLPLNFAKKIIGRSMNANDVGAYTFTLTPANAESPLRIQTANGFDATKTSVEAANTGAVSDNASAIHFADLVFTQDDIGKTFQYKVAETAKTGDVTTMDSGYYLIDVSVAYAAGELSAQVAGIRYVKDGTTVSLTADAQLPFTNNYTGSAEATISATKLLTANGHAYPLHQSFTFNLYEQTADGEKLIDTKSTAVGSANVTFDTIAYTNAKEGDVHTYLVKEAAPADGYAFATDGTSKTITVTLKYDTAAKQLVPEYKVDGVLTKAADAADGSVQPDVTIANTYAAVNTNAKVTISGSKLLLVNDEETQSNLAGFRFKAELLSATGAEGQDLKGTYEALHGTAALTAASDANGEFSFDEIVYTLDDLYTSTAYTTSATYLYKVTETRPDSNTFYGYDTIVFYYEVTLTDDTLGNLTAATQTYLGAGEDRTPADGIVFTNTANTTTATIRKDWVDINNALGGRPDSITVRVAAYYYDGNGNPVYVTDAVKDALGGSFHEKTAESYAYSAFTVTKDTDWTLLLENLPVEYYVAADDTTYELTYSASEEGMEDYETSYEDLTITNTVRVGAINIAKIVTDGKTYEGDESFTFNVYRVNGEKSILAAVKTIYYNGNENSNALLAGLPYGTYRIEEVKSMGAERYTTTITADGKVGDTVTLNKDLKEVTVTVTNTLSNTDYTTDTATVVNRYVYGSGWVQEFVNMPEDLNANEKSGRDDSPVAENQKAVLLPQKDQRVSNPTQGNDGDGAGGSGDGGADGPEPVNT